MLACREKLRYVSSERITEEIRKLACGVAAARIVREFSSVLAAVLPGFTPSLERLSSLPPKLPLRMAALLGTVSAADALRFSNKEREAVCCLLSAKAPTDVRAALREFGQEKAELLYAYHALPFSLPDGIWQISQLALSGSDLLEAGLQGAEIGKTLSALLHAVMYEGLPNERGALLAKIEEL